MQKSLKISVAALTVALSVTFNRARKRNGLIISLERLQTVKQNPTTKGKALFMGQLSRSAMVLQGHGYGKMKRVILFRSELIFQKKR
jgi:hypothetical protein